MIARLSSALRNSLLPTTLAATLLFSSTACEKIALLAPSGSKISLSANRSVLPVDGATEIVASVTEQAGTPVHNGTLVTFTTTLGRVEPAEARTSGGVARAMLHAGVQSGTATVRAFSGGGELTAELSIVIGAAAAQAVTLNATPTTVPSTGGAVQLLAAVLDAAGNRLPGVPVTFTATAGSLSSGTVITDDNGEARATLTTDRATTVTARAGNVASSQVPIAANAPPTITFTPPASATANEPVAILFTVAAGGSPVRNVIIEFGDGQSQALSNVAGSMTVNHTYNQAGLYTIIITATDSIGDQTRLSGVISVRPRAPISVTLTAAPTAGTAPLAVNFTATITGDASVAEFQWDFGDGTSRTTSGRNVSHVYTEAGVYTASVTAIGTTGNRGEAEIAVTVNPPAPINVTVTASPNPATAGSVVTLTATPATGVATYRWDFGDGSPVLETTGNAVTHVWTAHGIYTVTVTATGTSGQTGTGLTQVRVNP